MVPLQEFAMSLRFGDVLTFETLAMAPVFSRPALADPGYLLLQEATTAGLARVTELGGGTVPELLLENLAERPVLLVGGEELAGAKQNRMVNLTILAAARSRIVIPVSCVEAGRWHMTTPEFSPSGFVAFRRMRGSSLAHVTRSMRLHRSRRTDQERVWAEIAERSEELGAHSGTGAMRAIFEQRLSDVEAFVRALPYQEGQTGAAFFLGGRPAGLDVFDHPQTMEKMHGRLVRSYALDALAWQGARKTHSEQAKPAQAATKNGMNAVEVLRQWLAALDPAEMLVEPAVGMGQDVRWENRHLTAAALWAEERIVHFCAFPREESEPWRGSLGAESMAGAGWRQRQLRRRSRTDSSGPREDT